MFYLISFTDVMFCFYFFSYLILLTSIMKQSLFVILAFLDISVVCGHAATSLRSFFFCLITFLSSLEILQCDNLTVFASYPFLECAVMNFLSTRRQHNKL